MLREDTSPVKEEKVPTVAFGACNNTKKGMGRREGKTITLVPEATLVPAGIVRLVELQELGYQRTMSASRGSRTGLLARGACTLALSPYIVTR